MKKQKLKKKTRALTTAGKIIAIIQLILSALFCIFLWRLGVLPTHFLVLAGTILLSLFVVFFGIQFMKNKAVSIVGIVFSVLIILATAAGSFYVVKIHGMMDKVGGATYKTDNMVVIVRKDDPAESLMDIVDYKIGTQTTLDQENTGLMKEKLAELTETDLEYKEFETMEDLGHALLEHKVDAVVYNEPFTQVIDELIEGYGDNVRILYQYGIDKPVLDVKEEKRAEKAPFNVYISGIDVYGPITTNSRSDVNIIATVNPESKQVLLTTTPRDYYVEIPEISGGQKDKLTHAGIYGVDRSMATLGQVYGIDIDYYARVNFSSLITMVDLLGGIDVNSEYSFSAGGYTFNEGMNHLTGEAALAFARERHSFEAGDNQRGRNQEAVIVGMINKALTPAVLTKAGGLLASISDSMETNMTQEEMAELIQMQLNDGATWEITSVNAVGTGDMQSCYSSGSQLLYVMHPNWDSVGEISNKMKMVMEGQPLQ